VELELVLWPARPLELPDPREGVLPLSPAEVLVVPLPPEVPVVAPP
jgi:hypothetical protein